MLPCSDCNLETGTFQHEAAASHCLASVHRQDIDASMASLGVRAAGADDDSEESSDDELIAGSTAQEALHWSSFNDPQVVRTR